MYVASSLLVHVCFQCTNTEAVRGQAQGDLAESDPGAVLKDSAHAWSVCRNTSCIRIILHHAFPLNSLIDCERLVKSFWAMYGHS